MPGEVLQIQSPSPSWEFFSSMNAVILVRWKKDLRFLKHQRAFRVSIGRVRRITRASHFLFAQLLPVDDSRIGRRELTQVGGRGKRRAVDPRRKSYSYLQATRISTHLAQAGCSSPHWTLLLVHTTQLHDRWSLEILRCQDSIGGIVS